MAFLKLINWRAPLIEWYGYYFCGFSCDVIYWSESSNTQNHYSANTNEGEDAVEFLANFEGM